MVKKRFVFNKLPTPQKNIPDGFKKMNTISMKVFLICGLLIGLIVTRIIRSLLNYSVFKLDMKEIILCITLIITHEIIHGVFCSKEKLLRDIQFGCIPLKGIFYCYQENELTKARYLLTIIAPWVILTFLPLIILLGLNIRVEIIIDAIIFNSLVSGPDILNFIYSLIKIPNGAIITDRGFDQYISIVK